MRSIRIILIIAFLGMLFESWGQTKEETIKWLTEKMMKENFFEEDHYTGTTPAKITRAIFDDNFLIIDGVYSRDYKEGGRDYRIKENFKYGINLSKLSENVYEYGKYIATNGNFIEEISDWRKYRWQNGEYQLIDSKPSKEYIRYMRAVKINDKVEPEILDRFKKALKHYTTLMTSKKSNETF